MAGIAGYLGPAAERLDAPAIGRALSFTGRERIEEVRRGAFMALAVSHPAGTADMCMTYEDDGLSILLDGYFDAIEGKPPSHPGTGEALRACAELFRLEGAGFARRLNGSFVLAVCDHRAGTACLLTDRLGSRAVYYMHKGDIMAFSSRLEAFFPMGLDPTRKLNRQGLVEFMVYSRQLEAGLWEDVRKVPSSTALSFTGGAVEEKAYWDLKFAYDRRENDIEENAEMLACALKEATGRAVASFDSIGLLLSGGLDSRAVLACLPEETICYTVCDCLNFETRMAVKAALERGCSHVLLKRSPFHYLETLPEAVRVCESASEYYHAHLLGFPRQMDKVSGGVVLSGFGLDGFLRGVYLPRLSGRFGGSRFSLPVMQAYRCEAEAEEALLRKRWIETKAMDVLTADVRNDFPDYPRQGIRAFIQRSTGAIVGVNDLIEMFIFGNVADWPSFSNINCIRQHFNERSVALDNALLDIALRTPPEQRFDSRLFKRALKLIDPRMSVLTDANTFLPACVTGGLNEIKHIPNFLHKRVYAPIAARTRSRGVPAWTITRTSWHDHDIFWRCSSIADRLEGLLSDPAAMRDDVIDPAAAAEFISRHRRGAGSYTQVLVRLITFLEWRKTNP